MKTESDPDSEFAPYARRRLIQPRDGTRDRRKAYLFIAIVALISLLAIGIMIFRRAMGWPDIPD